MGVTPVYVSGDEGEAGVLEVGECWTYTAVGVAEEGQYENNACVDGYYGTVLVEDCDLSHYFGANPDIDIEKATNGADADDPTGPSITVGGPVTWTYVVCNTGNVALTDIEVTDDMGVTPVYVSGDEGEAGVLEVGECWTYTATGTAELGQYENNACVDGTWLGILPDDAIDDVIVSDCDPSHYIGVEIGNTFCSWTQGFWGNAGGKSCGGQTTSELIAAALAANGGSIMVGQTGHSITFDSVECILASLPAGGKPSALPAGNFTCADLSSFYKNKKQTEINNVLVGQAVALTLNLLVADNCLGEDSGDLGAWILEADFCTVPYGDEEACAEYSMIPESLADGVNTVADLLAAVNAALGGTGDISDAYSGASAINEAFDECRTIVPCIRPEICGNGCDDDGDGDVDLDDEDCQQPG
jgi:uncharacterized repeat protein (TIGR01451 family)